MDLNLPTTSYIVLGLLSFGDALSGYDIRKVGQTLQYFYWSPAQSQIYRELRRLQAEEFVESWHVAQEGKPNKQMFRITAEGTAVFKHWLSHAELPPTVIKHPLLLKLFFNHLLDKEEQIKLIKAFIENTRENISQLTIVEEFVEMDPNSTHSKHVVAWSLSFYQSELARAQTLLVEVEES